MKQICVNHKIDVINLKQMCKLHTFYITVYKLLDGANNNLKTD